MSAVLSVQRFGNPAGQPAIFSKMEMQLFGIIACKKQVTSSEVTPKS